MSNLEMSIFNIGYIESISYKDTIIHKIDARIKIITVIFYIFTVISFDKYTISSLLPMIIFPVLMITLGEIPFKFILKKLLILSPFVFFIAVFNPIFDKKIILHLGSFSISGGWISFLSTLLKYILTVSATFALIAAAGYYNICFALEKLYIPKIFVIQLLLIYRYIFVLIEESFRLVRSYRLRAFHDGIKLKNYISLISILLIRSINRAERIYLSMLSRGFDGTININKKYIIKKKDIVFLLTCLIYFFIVRYFNLTSQIGKIILGGIK